VAADLRLLRENSESSGLASTPISVDIGSVAVEPRTQRRTQKHMMMPHSWNPHFVGREALLDALRKCLSDTKPKEFNRRVALYGMAGVGKTQLAIEYANRNEPFYETGIFWMHAKDRASLLHHFQIMGERIGCARGAKAGEVATVVLSWLQERKNWLMIFDNLDDITVADGLLPQTTWEGHTIITTRNPNADGIPAQGLEVPVYELSEAVELLLTRSQLRHVGEIEEAEAKVIAQELGCLPLALEQAAAYIREELRDISKFLHRYRTNRKRFHNRTPTGNWWYKESVTTTWSLSFQLIRDKDIRIARLLQLFSVLNPDGIMIDFLTAGKDGLDSGLRPVVEEPHILESALFVLEQFSLIRRSDGGDTIGIHRLLQYVIREEMSAQEFEETVHVALKLSEAAFPRDRSWNTLDSKIVSVCRTFQEQVLAPLTVDGWAKDRQWGEFAEYIGNFLVDDGQAVMAVIVLTEALHVHTGLLGKRHPETLRCMRDLAVAYRELGKRENAVQLQREALAITTDVLGDEHQDTILSKGELSCTLCWMDAIDESVRLCEEAVKTAEPALGLEHPVMLRLLLYLGIAYWARGRIDDAVVVTERLYACRTKLCGERHHDTLDSRHNLAIYYRMQGRLDEAAKLDETNLELKTQIYGPEHAFTLDTLGNLARIYWLQGRVKESLHLRVILLDRSRRVMGEAHSETLLTKCDLATNYEEQGNLTEAAMLLQSCLEDRRRILGAEHLDTIQTQVRLAMIYQRDCKLQEASNLAIVASGFLRRQVASMEDPALQALLPRSQSVNSVKAMELCLLTTSATEEIVETIPLIRILEIIREIYRIKGKSAAYEDLGSIIARSTGRPDCTHWGRLTNGSLR
jgi:tetratricopeptide (TPR) repeat protein